MLLYYLLLFSFSHQLIKELIKMVKAKNIISDRGNPITNQIIITDEKKDTETFQSYDSIIAVKGWTKEGKRKVTLDEYYWNYSRTTSKYRNAFLGEDTLATSKKLMAGVYKLANLNK